MGKALNLSKNFVIQELRKIKQYQLKSVVQKKIKVICQKNLHISKKLTL